MEVKIKKKINTLASATHYGDQRCMLTGFGSYSGLYYIVKIMILSYI